MKPATLLLLLLLTGCAYNDVSNLVRDLDMVGCDLAELRQSREHTVIRCWEGE